MTLIIFKRVTITLDIKGLLKEVIKEEIKFTKEVAEKSGIDLEEEELYAVGNMIKVRKLERETEEKDKIIEENKKTIEEKDKEIKRLKSQLKTK